jgi:hypothetical protein
MKDKIIMSSPGSHLINLDNIYIPNMGRLSSIIRTTLQAILILMLTIPFLFEIYLHQNFWLHWYFVPIIWVSFTMFLCGIVVILTLTFAGIIEFIRTICSPCADLFVKN